MKVLLLPSFSDDYDSRDSTVLFCVSRSTMVLAQVDEHQSSQVEVMVCDEPSR